MIVQIAVVNRSTLVTNEDVRTMTCAVHKQVAEDFCPAWGLIPIPVLFWETDPPDDSYVVVVTDDPDMPNALGDHSETWDDRPYGQVFAKPVLDGGGLTLIGAFTISSVLSHEVLELIADPFIADWSDSPQGQEWAKEVCDPVESDYYALDGVSVSNFVFPNFFDPAAKAPTDKMGTLVGPFVLASGGYAVVRSGPGAAVAIYGSSVRGYRRDGHATTHSRTGRRLKAKAHHE